MKPSADQPKTETATLSKGKGGELQSLPTPELQTNELYFIPTASTLDQVELLAKSVL